MNAELTSDFPTDHHRQRSLWQLVTDILDKLSVLVDRLLEKQPAKRFSSAADVREQLTKILAQHLTKHSCIFQPENLGWQT